MRQITHRNVADRGQMRVKNRDQESIFGKISNPFASPHSSSRSNDHEYTKQ